MRGLFWLVVLAAIVAMVYTVRLIRRRYEERRRASDERAASMLAQFAPPPAAPAPATVAQPRVEAQERLLLEAAGKAAEAGEPALGIQLYARLLSRYPETSFGAQARAAVEALKRKLAKP